MALTSESGTLIPELFESEDMPSRTFKIDWENKRILSTMVDDRAAIEQFVLKSLFDRRNAHIIYSDDYASDIELILELNYTDDLLESELTRVITEALVYDDRISGVDLFEFNREEDVLQVSFRVLTFAYDDISIQGVALNV